MKAACALDGLLCRVEVGFESRTQTVSLHFPIKVVTLTGCAGIAATAVGDLTARQGHVAETQEDVNNPRPGM